MAYRPYSSKRTEAAQRAIGDALLELLDEMSFSDIAITTLCERAKVSRPTFYRHFDATEDVLGYYAQHIYDELAGSIAPIIGRGNESLTIIGAVFAGLVPYQRLFEAMMRNDMIGPLFGHMWMLMGNPYAGMTSLNLGSAGSDDSHTFDVIAYSWGGTYSLMFTWILEGMKRSPEEMAAAVIESGRLVGSTFSPEFHAGVTAVHN